MKKIGVIGGGPAGIIAAATAAKGRENEVVLLEKNDKLGKKLSITGKGRCNITNGMPIEDFFDNIVTNHFFMYSGLYTFNNDDIISLLNLYGVETKLERGNRVFPKSDKASDVIAALERYLKDQEVDVQLRTEVFSIKHENDKFVVKSSHGTYEFDKLCIATGGMSYQVTGSTGDGYKFSETFGHSVIKPKPSLVPLRMKNKWLRDIQGLSLRNVTLSTYHKNKLVVEEFGDLLFSHFGITGPIVLTTSSKIHNYNKNDIRMFIDLKPALTHEVLDARILRDFEDVSNKQFKNSLDKLLPKAIIPVVIQKSAIDPEKVVNQITKEERESLVNAMKRFSLNYDGHMPIDHAIVTSGGVNVHEINSSTMESQLFPGLYFAGEVIDVDALTGGFNLQIAYSTGYLAGSNM